MGLLDKAGGASPKDKPVAKAVAKAKPVAKAVAKAKPVAKAAAKAVPAAKVEQPVANKKEKKPKAARPCLLYTSPSPRDMRRSRMPSSA